MCIRSFSSLERRLEKDCASNLPTKHSLGTEFAENVSMHSILASGLISLGKACLEKACDSFRTEGSQDNFQARLNAAQSSTAINKSALEVHKSSLERQILQHPAFKNLGLDAPSLDPLCITPSPDGTYTLNQGDKALNLNPKAHPLGPLLHNYYKTREALEASSSPNHQLALGSQTFSFHPSSFS